MARWTNPSDEQLQGYLEWVDERPEPVKSLAKQFDPWTLYLLKSSDHRVTVHGFFEDGTMSVNVTGQFNLLGFERRVFGILPDDLEECDLPLPGEPLGVTMTEEETLDHINAKRAELGHPPLTKEELDAIRGAETPVCAVGNEAPDKVEVHHVDTAEEAFEILRQKSRETKA
jgi:hypothetical protein